MLCAVIVYVVVVVGGVVVAEVVSVGVDAVECCVDCDYVVSGDDGVVGVNVDGVGGIVDDRVCCEVVVVRYGVVVVGCGVYEVGGGCSVVAVMCVYVIDVVVVIARVGCVVVACVVIEDG